MSYAYYRTLTINHAQCGASDSSNFPVLVYISHSTMKTVGNGGHIQHTVTQSGGMAVTMPADLVFTSDSGGTTKIPWEIDSYDGTNGILWAWVKVATVSHTADTVFYVFYDDAGVSTQQNTSSLSPSNVWDSNYKGVWHLGGATLDASESTSNAYNGTLTGSPTVGTGQVDGSAHFPGGSDRVNIATFTNFARPMSIECWGNMTTNQNYLQAHSYNGNFIVYGNGTRVGFYITGGAEMDTGVGVMDGTWHHIAVVIDNSGNGVTYIDGVSSATGTSQAPNTSTQLDFGSYSNSSAGSDIDEVRISNIARSQDWYTTQFNNQKTSSTFLTVGSETGAGSSFNPAIAVRSGQVIGGGIY